MLRGNNRKIVAAWILVSCLVLAIPQGAEARLIEPSHHDQITSTEGPALELTFWERIWETLQSLWSKDSVLIIPD